MRRLSLRRTVYALIARVLSRWLHAVTARLDAADERPSRDPRQPPPPDHWVELVRQHAPKLLDSESPDAAESGLVIDWRADDAPVEAPPTVRTRPLRLHPAQVAAKATPPKPKPRPLRLERVAVEALAAEDVSAHAAEPSDVRVTERPVTTTIPELDAAPVAAYDGAPAAEAVIPPEVNTSTPAQAPVKRRRGIRLPSLKLPARGQRELPEPDAPREIFSAPFERQHIRETRSSIPNAPAVPTIRTGAGGSVVPRQQHTGIPAAPPQLVMRPTHHYPPLNMNDIAPERWASLPETPDDEAHDSDSRYERLRREQEGRAWSE